MAIQTRGKAVHAANLGLYLDRPNLLVPERGLCDGSLNFRITNAQLTNHNVGWSSFNDLNLDGKPVLLIEEFEPTGGTRKLILGNTTDLFQYVSSTLTYITPIYATGTVTVTAADETVTLVGGNFTTAGIKPGDFIFFGAADEDDPAATGNGGWYEVASVTDATHLELTTDGPTVAGVAYTIRLTFTSSMFEPYLTETFRNAVNVIGTDGDRWYATNGADKIVGWDGVTAQVYYSHSGVDTCKALRRFKNTLHLIAPTIGGALNPGRVVTSAIGEPENTSTLEATSIIIGDGDVPLIAAQRIGELLAYYSEREIILAQFVGAPIMFVFRQAVAGYGARSPRGIVRFPTHHTLFATDGQYNFDGVSATQSSSHVWKEVTRRSSPNRTELVQGIIDEGNAELLWVVPLNSDADADDGPPEHAYVGHYLEDSGEFPMPHSFRDLPATAVGTYLSQSQLTFAQLTEGFDEYSIRWDDQQIQVAFPQVLFGTADGDIFQLNSQTQDGTVPVSFVRFSRRPLVDSRFNGIVTRVYPSADFQLTSTDEMTINLRLFDSPNSVDARQEVEYTILLDGSQRFAPFRCSGRFVEAEFGTGPTHSGLWRLEGYDMDVAPGGER
jgi:hypothetical protein